MNSNRRRILPPQKYRDGSAGRSEWDIVHMIPYCIEVLQGRVPEQNERKITKPVALILLAHYVADIHQPLHVGAAYFDEQGRFAEPEKNKAALADEGGNTFTLELSDEPPRRRGIHKKKFHGFWDYDAVNALFAGVPRYLPSKEFPAQIEPMKKALVRSEEHTSELQSLTNLVCRLLLEKKKKKKKKTKNRT